AIRSPAGAAACSFDSIFGEDRIAPALIVLARLAAGLRQLVPAVAIDFDSLPAVSAGSAMVGIEFCDVAWRQVLGRLGHPLLGDSIPFPDRLRALREAGLLGRYYRELGELVTQRATAMRDRTLKERPALYFAFRFPSAPGDWLTLALVRGFSSPERPILLFTPELLTRDLMAGYRLQGINAVHAMELSAANIRSVGTSPGNRTLTLKHAAFTENDGFWVAA